MTQDPNSIDLDEAERLEFLKQPRFIDDASTDDWAEPMPLVRSAGQPEPFPTDALGTVLENAALGIADIVQCPPAIAACSVLAVAAFSRPSRMST